MDPDLYGYLIYGKSDSEGERMEFSVSSIEPIDYGGKISSLHYTIYPK